MIIASFSDGDSDSKPPAGLEVDCRDLAASVDFDGADGRDVAVQARLLAADRDRVLAQIEAAFRVAKAGRDVAFGCVDGRYRSVAMAEMLAHMLRENGFSPIVRHLSL